MIRRGVKVQLAAFLALTIVGISFVSARYVGLGDQLFGSGYVVTADFPPSLPDVSVDPVQLDQVLTNLLENAGRHAPKGSEIRVSVLWMHGSVQVRVSDEGPGIPLAERDRVFEAFYRGTSSPETPGSGLGLAIAKAVVVAHGGRIWIEGNPEGGCVVAFEIPGEDGLS